MGHHNNFCKQPLGNTGYPEWDIVGPFLSLKDLEILCQSLMIHLALKHSCQQGEALGGEETLPLCRSIVHYCIAEPFEGRVGQQIKFVGRRETSPSKGSVTVENIALVELAECCGWYWHPPIRQNISHCGNVSGDTKPSGSGECITNTLRQKFLLKSPSFICNVLLGWIQWSRRGKGDGEEIVWWTPYLQGLLNPEVSVLTQLKSLSAQPPICKEGKAEVQGI